MLQGEVVGAEWRNSILGRHEAPGPARDLPVPAVRCPSPCAVCRLVEALEQYDGRGNDSLGMPHDLMDTYASEDVESQLLSAPLKGHRVRQNQSSCSYLSPVLMLSLMLQVPGPQGSGWRWMALL